MVKAWWVTAVMISCLGFFGNAFAISAGSPAPDFDLPGTKGNVKLSNASGSVIYLDFWASWCGPCRQSFPWMNSMQEKYRAQGLQVIGVNLDAKNEDVQKFLSQLPAQFTVAFDSKGTTPGAYGVKGMPTSFLIGRDGKIIEEHSGFRESDRDVLEQKIKSALEAGK
ncbi:MAG: TlpA family protein disulfide reductase [Chlorobiaceae bacterium]|nr:TlpA family protein disulfide reductase [Chlorobiaceae bacterium]